MAWITTFLVQKYLIQLCQWSTELGSVHACCLISPVSSLWHHACTNLASLYRSKVHQHKWLHICCLVILWTSKCKISCNGTVANCNYCLCSGICTLANTITLFFSLDLWINIKIYLVCNINSSCLYCKSDIFHFQFWFVFLERKASDFIDKDTNTKAKTIVTICNCL